MLEGDTGVSQSEWWGLAPTPGSDWAQAPTSHSTVVHFLIWPSRNQLLQCLFVTLRTRHISLQVAPMALMTWLLLSPHFAPRTLDHMDLLTRGQVPFPQPQAPPPSSLAYSCSCLKTQFGYQTLWGAFPDPIPLPRPG